jgi:antimicrobial peptide system SdpB family protein
MAALEQLVNYFYRPVRYGFALGIARTVLAFGTFLTLVANNSHLLFKTQVKPFLDNQLIPVNFINIFMLTPDRYIGWAKLIACLVLLLVMSGWRPRVTCILHWYIAACFLNAAVDVDGGDQITSNLALWLIPISLLDNRKWHWIREYASPATEFGLARNIFVNFNFLAIRLQMAVIYLHAAVGKFSVPEWINGSAIYYWSRHPEFGLGDTEFRMLRGLFQSSLLLFCLNWMVLILELLLFMGLVMDRKYYKKLFILGVGFHFFIIWMHGLVSFFFAMTGGLTLYFLVDYYASYNKELQLSKI